MKTLLVIFVFLPVFGFSQNELIVKGKMNYGDIKTSTVRIIEKENPNDTITVVIDKKKFKLEPLDISKSYELIFTCGDWSKTLRLEKKEGETIETTIFHIEITWEK